MKSPSGQNARILARLQSEPDKDVSATELHRAGSGKENGYCASLTRRISDLRARGHDVIKSRDEHDGVQRHTWYCLRSKAQ